MNRWMRDTVCTLVMCVCLASAATAEEIDFVIFRQGGTYYGEICLSVAGATGVRMLRDGDTDWTVFDQYGSEFEIESDFFSSLAAINAEIAGDYTLQVEHAGGTSHYTFTISLLDDAWFPSNPVLDAVPSVIPQQYTFSWAWSGTADVKCAESWGWNGTEGFDVESWYDSADPLFGATTYDVDYGTYVGQADFFVDYSVEVDNLIVNWALDSGDDLFGTDGVQQALASEATAEFTVVPEPATLSLLGLGALALLRRRRAQCGRQDDGRHAA